MAANTVPVFTNVPIVGAGLTSTTSNSALSGTSLANSTTIVTGATNGTKVAEINCIPTGTILVGTVNIFLEDASNNFWLYDQIQVSAQTLTTGNPQQRWNKQYPKLIVPTGWSLVVTQTGQTTNALVVIALGSTF